MATTKRNLDIYKGEHEFTLIIRTDGLSPGKYNCFAVIYSVNDFGSNRVHDRVENACGFEKVLKIMKQIICFGIIQHGDMQCCQK